MHMSHEAAVLQIDIQHYVLDSKNNTLNLIGVGRARHMTIYGLRVVLIHAFKLNTDIIHCCVVLLWTCISQKLGKTFRKI